MEERAAEIVIRPISREDASALAALEARCEGAARWGEVAYQKIGSSGIRGWVAQEGDGVLGFILVCALADEMEILNLAVDPDARRRRIGSRLLARAFGAASAVRVRQMYLEVRESNAGARAFYLAAGFGEQGRRKNYYSQPVEDALLLGRQVD